MYTYDVIRRACEECCAISAVREASDKTSLDFQQLILSAAFFQQRYDESQSSGKWLKDVHLPDMFDGAHICFYIFGSRCRRELSISLRGPLNFPIRRVFPRSFLEG
jgi:hypothetical protein